MAKKKTAAKDEKDETAREIHGEVDGCQTPVGGDVDGVQSPDPISDPSQKKKRA